MRLGAIGAAGLERDDAVVAAAGDPHGVAEDGDVGGQPRDPQRRRRAARRRAGRSTSAAGVTSSRMSTSTATAISARERALGRRRGRLRDRGQSIRPVPGMRVAWHGRGQARVVLAEARDGPRG